MRKEEIRLFSIANPDYDVSILNVGYNGDRRPEQLMFLFLDESYVNRNHSLGSTWYHPDDIEGAAVCMSSGKGERLVLLTAITEEFGILDLDLLDGAGGTLLIFQARKRTGDYHQNMNGLCFNTEWLTKKMIPALKKHNIEAIFVLDNASYHLVPYPGSINVDSWTTKKQFTDFMDQYSIPYVPGRAPKGDNAEQLKAKTKEWLAANAEGLGLLVDVTHMGQLCREHGHHILLTPPYHPELQPIEKLWRNVKMYVARKFAGTRTMPELLKHVREGFEKYGTAEHCARSCVAEARKFEILYNTPLAHALSVPEESDDDSNSVEDDPLSDSDDDSSDDDQL